MHVRLRLFRQCTVVAAMLGWTMTAAASAFIANPTAQIQEPLGSSPDDSRLVKTPAGPPANLDAGVFRQVVQEMWRDSPRFRRQCQRLAAERGLVVKLFAQPPQRQSSVRATTEISGKGGVVMHARVVIFSPVDTVELIAHEIEHIIEQLDGVTFAGSGSTRTTREAGDAYETGRAVEIGRVVAREVRETRGRVVVNLPQREQPGGSLAPPSANVSADGRFIAFTSAARLAPADKDDDMDLYVLDVETGKTTLESSKPGWATRYRPILYPRIAGGGRFVVFQAVAEDGPPSFPWQVVVLDRRDRTARVVSADAQGRLANGHCMQASISADGTTVVFESLATNLTESGDANGNLADIYVVRLPGGDLSRVSVASDGSQPIVGHSVTPAVSADGRYVAFTSTADFECSSAPPCVASGNRRKPVPEIYLHDTTTNVTSLISRGSKGQNPNGPSSWPAVSGDGRYVAFVSEATNLVRDDLNGRADIFLRDTSVGTTELVSRRPDGKAGNGASSLPVISWDGQTVAFQSFASDLICIKDCSRNGRDINLLLDVFVYNRASGVMVRASEEEPDEWMETSHAPSIDGAGRVLVFASRHPIGAEDMDDDDDLFLWLKGSVPAAMMTRNRQQ